MATQQLKAELFNQEIAATENTLKLSLLSCEKKPFLIQNQ